MCTFKVGFSIRVQEVVSAIECFLDLKVEVITSNKPDSFTGMETDL
jgi:hypothetical protein